MEASLYDIEARFKEIELMFATKGDFTLGAARSASARIVLEQPGWSPYCVDIENRALIFVRLPAETDLAAAPFFYITQFQQATQLLSVPLADLGALSADLPDPALILVFSIGRCGTTLVSHALNGAEGVWSLSEPDVVDHKALDDIAAAGIDPNLYIQSMLRLLAAAAPGGRRVALAIKFRSQALFRTSLFFAARPDARYVFMYRDALKWGESFLQFIANLGAPIPLDQPTRDFAWTMMSAGQPLAELGFYVDLAEPHIHPAPMFAASWIVHLENYLSHLASGVPFLALRYDEIVANPKARLAKLFAHCGLSQAGVTPALAAFDEDSQKGTLIARKDERQRFEASHIAVFRATLAKKPRFADPGLILPDIYSKA